MRCCGTLLLHQYSRLLLHPAALPDALDRQFIFLLSVHSICGGESHA